MNGDEHAILAEALRWHDASHDDAMDWDGFTTWLEQDARHREAYDTVALGGALIAEHRDTLDAALQNGPLAANDDQGAAPVPAPRARARWFGMAIAASLVALLAVPQLLPGPATTWRTEATSRRIALADGSSVLLAPHSSLTVEGRRQDRIALAGGAWFDIRHDPSRTLAITAGEVEIGDIGTQFDVQADGSDVRVEVADGEVEVRSPALARPIRVVHGRALTFDGRAGTAIVQPRDASGIGEWRSGRLSFDSAPLPLVAADLARYAGVRVTVARGLQNRQFSGTLVIDHGAAAARDLAQLMGLELRPGAGGAGFVLDERR